MGESVVSRLKEHLMARSRPIPFPPACERDIAEAESRLAFSIPPLLKSVYIQIGNGGFGPGNGGSVIGLHGGYASDFGPLVETYEQLKGDHALEGKQWGASVLPFCEWRCNIFTCVDCREADYPIYLFEEGDVSPTHYSLQDFFQMWIEGADILPYGRASDSAEVTNPFTGRKSRVNKRRKK